MTPLAQRGYDDQTAGMLNPALADADTAEGREYREGARAARRDTQDPSAVRTATSYTHAEGCTCHDCNLGGGEPQPSPEPTPAATPSMYAEPEPAARRPRKAKPVDDAQASLF